MRHTNGRQSQRFCNFLSKKFCLKWNNQKWFNCKTKNQTKKKQNSYMPGDITIKFKSKSVKTTPQVLILCQCQSLFTCRCHSFKIWQWALFFIFNENNSGEQGDLLGAPESSMQIFPGHLPINIGKLTPLL